MDDKFKRIKLDDEARRLMGDDLPIAAQEFMGGKEPDWEMYGMKTPTFAPPSWALEKEPLEESVKPAIKGPSKITAAQFKAVKSRKDIRDFVEMFNNAAYLKRIKVPPQYKDWTDSHSAYEIMATPFAAKGIAEKGGFHLFHTKQKKGEGGYPVDYWTMVRVKGLKIPGMSSSEPGEIKVSTGSTLATYSYENLDGLSGQELLEKMLAREAVLKITNIQPGDFWHQQGEFTIEVTGDAYAIKDDLKKLGFRWKPEIKSWVKRRIRPIHPASTPKQAAFFAKQPSEKEMKDALAKVKQIVKDNNEKIRAANVKELEKQGYEKPEMWADPKKTVKLLSHFKRAAERLKKYGIEMETDFPSQVPGFHTAKSPTVKFSGKTFGSKEAFKTAGFRWNRGKKQWEISLADFDVIREKFVKGILKDLAISKAKMIEGCGYLKKKKNGKPVTV